MSGKHSLRRDFLASIVVFLVALPLCLGIAIASGAPPMAGLITGIIGGVVVGTLAGSPLQVSGPAAGLVALTYEVIEKFGLAGLGIILLIAGSFQVIAGILRLGQWFRAISPAVIQGMLAGIGVLIVASQFHVMLDVAPESNGLANILTIPESVMKGLFPPNDTSSHHWAAMIGVFSIMTLLGWNLLSVRLRMIPGPLVAVVVAVILTALLQLPINFVEVPGQFLDAITLPTAQSLQLLGNTDIWIMAMTFAMVASAETMLSAAAVDHMHHGPRTEYEREMIAQGVGNATCGLLGVLPLTGVIVRSSANVQAGAQTRLSAILHGAWLLGLVAFFPFLLEKIPTACLAAILVYTSSKMIRVDAMKKLWRVGGIGEVVIYAATLFMVVATNLLEGVIVGAILSVIKLLYTFSKLEGYTVPNGESQVDLFLKGSASFLSLPRLVAILEKQPQGRQLHVHLEQLTHIDQACIEHLQNWQSLYKLSGGTATIEWQALTDRFAGKTLPEGNGMSSVH
jgi:MFS superfamily sulfate permease-like transporter